MRWKMPAGRSAAAGILTALLAALILISGCDDDGGGSGTLTFTVDGSPVEYSFQPQAGEEDSATMWVVGFGDVFFAHPFMYLTFPTGTGTYSSPSGGATIEHETTTRSFQASDGLAGSSYEITVTRCGAVGETFQGTFSGVLVDVLGNSQAITNGQFSVTRAQ